VSIYVEHAPQSRRRFFVWMSVALAVAVLWGFGPTYFLRAFIHTRDLASFVHVHAVIYISWIALFVVQSALVARHRTDVHRRLGVAGVVLGIAVVVAGIVVTLVTLPPARRDAWEAVHGPIASFLWLARGNAGNPMMFGLLFASAIALRRRPQAHKRLMLLACLALMNAPLARAFDDLGWPIHLAPFGFEASNSPFLLATPFLVPRGFINLIVLPFFAALVGYDLVKTRRLHPATLCGGLVLFLFTPVAILLFPLTNT